MSFGMSFEMSVGIDMDFYIHRGRTSRIISAATGLCFFGRLLGGLRLIARPHFVHHFDVIVENRGNDGDHVSFHHTGPYTLRAAHSNVDNTLESQAPFPHFHQVLAPALLEDAYQALDAAINGEDISNAGGRCCEVGKVIKRVD
jgi:hypothetical protein